MSERERRNTAYHEAGHAIVAHVLPHLDKVHQISIIPSGRALGYTMSLPAEDKYSVYKEELKERIAELLAGRVAESIVFGDISGGASNDIERATKIARQMVTQLGMSDELGPVMYGSGQSEVFLGRDFSANKDYSDAVAAKIDAEIKALVEEGYARAKEILTERREKLDFIAEFLLMYEIMDGDQFEAAMDKNATVRELEAMNEEKKRISEEENAAKAKASEEREPLAKEAIAIEAPVEDVPDEDASAEEATVEDASAEDEDNKSQE
jgi:cell division protease FtsH